ncbi:MAG: hypothetical protein PVG86_05150 [Desulfobacterales bacterium]|jgi:hypothetical protein
MKPLKHEDHVKLRKALSWAYRKKEDAEVSDVWQIKAMERIRNLDPFHTQPSYLDLFQRLVWQLAPVACVLLFILGIVLSQIDFMPDYVIAKIFMEDPADYSLLALL